MPPTETDNEPTTWSLTRPNFFDRQSLNAGDLNALVDYVRERGRRHNRHAVGWGVTCGLEVDLVDGNPWEVEVRPGFAIMPSGEEVEATESIVVSDICPAARSCLDIPGPCPDPENLDGETHTPFAGVRSVDFRDPSTPQVAPNPRRLDWAVVEVLDATGLREPVTSVVDFPPITGLDLGHTARIRLDNPTAAITLVMARAAASPRIRALDATGAVLDEQLMTGPTLTAQSITLEGADIVAVSIESDIREAFLLAIEVPQVPRGDVYLVVCPDERPVKFAPGVPEHCQPADANMHPARVCEGARFEVRCTLPEGQQPLSCDELRDIVCDPAHVPCPPDDVDECVVVATLTISDGGIVAVDEFSDRRRLLPGWVVADRTACACDDPVPPWPEPTIFTTLPTIFTGFPTIFTTLPTIFTALPTIFTALPTIFTALPTALPTVFTTLPTIFTALPTDFTAPPTLFTSLPTTFSTLPTLLTGLPSFIDSPTGPIDGPIFNIAVGSELDVRELAGIGTARADLLRNDNITNLTEFIESPSERLSELLGVSEVRIARMKDEARERTLEGEQG